MTRGLSQFPPRLLRLIARLLERQLVLWLLLLRLLPVLSLVLLRGGVQGKATEMAEGPPALAARRGVLLHGKQQREEIRCTDAEADSAAIIAGMAVRDWRSNKTQPTCMLQRAAPTCILQ